MTSCTSLGCRPARSAAVAHDVQADAGETGLGRELLEAPVGPVRLERRSIGLGEHQVVVLGRPWPQAPLLALLLSPGAQEIDYPGGERDQRGAALGLGPIGQHAARANLV